MARPLRIDEPGLWHHVMNRGSNRCPIFTNTADYHLFLHLLAQSSARFDIGIHAFCLMTNHYHLLLSDPRGLLSRAARHINGVYTQRYNRRHNRDGPLFRGRFLSKVVQQEDYSLNVVRYIHLNPVAAKMVACAGDYQWSSHRHYMSHNKHPWLQMGQMLSHFGSVFDCRAAFDIFIHQEQASEQIQLPSNCEPFLGNKAFHNDCRQRVRRSDALQRAVNHQVARFIAPTIVEVTTAVARSFDLPEEELYATRRGKVNPARAAAIWLCKMLTRATNEKIGEAFGVTRNAVASSKAQVNAILMDEPEWRQRVTTIIDAYGKEGCDLRPDP